MTGSERPSPEPLLKKEASPAILGGERILEMLLNFFFGKTNFVNIAGEFLSEFDGECFSVNFSALFSRV